MSKQALTPRTITGYGWRPDQPDMRDVLYAAPHETVVKQPVKVSLRRRFPPPYDQGQLGSCTGNAIAGVIEFEQRRQKETEGQQTPSRLFVYYGEREIEGTIDSDAGAEIRDGIKVVAKLGAPAETDWPYDISRFAERPPQQAYTDAVKYRALRYARVAQTQTQILATLAAKQPIVFGFTVYESFESEQVATDGMVPMPSPGEQVLGGHATVAIGYDATGPTTLVEVRNSWGRGWGDHGYCFMPLAYLVDPQLASDFWVIRTVT